MCLSSRASYCYYYDLSDGEMAYITLAGRWRAEQARFVNRIPRLLRLNAVRCLVDCVQLRHVLMQCSMSVGDH